MAIIKPTRENTAGKQVDKFTTSYIKEGVPQIVIDKNNNTDGLWVIFLPPYKTENGQNYFFRLIKVRNNFNKTKYVVDPDNDPVTYFNNRLYKFFPEEYDCGKDPKGFTLYPPSGPRYPTSRVLYNISYANREHKDAKKAFLFDAPSSGIGDQISNYHDTKNALGKLPPLIWDFEKATPVGLTLDGMKWQVAFDRTEAIDMPKEFMPLEDEDAIYNPNVNNLDEVVIVRDPQELISTLRTLYVDTIYSKCIEGYQGSEDNVYEVKTDARVTEIPDAPVTKPTTSKFASPPKAEDATPAEVTLPNHEKDSADAAEAMAFLKGKKK